MNEDGPVKRIVDLLFLNSLDSPRCPSCRLPFTLGETVVLATGSFEGCRYVHEADARFDRGAGGYVERAKR
ncbi:MAG: hypothetical protein AB1921_18335 [Thermodesulfobacteriota bacterium]